MLSTLCEGIVGTVIQMSIKTYSELITLPTFEERYKYLKLNGTVGEATFGFDRYLNQVFYKTSRWRDVRDFVIIRDNGCDLGIEGREIGGLIIVHHMNPIDTKDILDMTEFLLDPNYLISTMHTTHNAIHYGDENLLLKFPVERTRNDTCPWRK
jgi:hypothetical protein